MNWRTRWGDRAFRVAIAVGAGVLLYKIIQGFLP